MKRFLTSALAIMIVTPFILSVMIGFWILDSFVTKFVWNMLAVPLFGVKPITVAGAMAIGLIVGCFRSRMRTVKKNTSEENWEQLRNYFISTLFLLAATFVISKYFLGA